MATGAITPTSFSASGDTWNIQNNMTIGATTWTVAGSVTATAGHLAATAATSHGTVNIGGNLSLSGAVYFGSTSTTAFGGDSLIVNLSGNLSISGTARFVNTPSWNLVNFVNTSSSLSSPQTITNSSTSTTASYTYFYVNSGCVAQLNSNFNMGTGSAYAYYGQFNVLGTLNCKTFYIGDDGSCSFTLNPGATLITANAAGITTTAAAGAIRTSTRTYDATGHYVYNGTVAQVTGNGLPTTLTTPGSVTVSNSSTGVTLTQATTFDTGTTLFLVNGNLVNTATNLVMQSGAIVQRDNGSISASPATYSGINLIYANLGYHQTTLTTGNEFPNTFNGNVTINHNGATISLDNNKTLPVYTFYGNMVIDSGSLDATTSNYNIALCGNWTNNSGIGAFVPRIGTVTFNGVVAQTLGGTSATVFNGLTLNNSLGLAIADSETVNDTLNLMNGNITIGSNNLILGPSAPAVSGTFSPTSMIIANGTGLVKKQFSTIGSYLFPIGDGSSNYTPISLNFTSGTLVGTGFSGVNVANIKHPSNANITDFLNRYWSVRSAGISGASYTVNASYVLGDVVGTEGNISAGQYPLALPWAKFDVTNITTHTLTAAGVTNTNADFSGISTLLPTITLTPTSTLICSGASITLNPVATRDTPFTYSWLPTTGLSSSTGNSVVVTPTVTTIYTVTLTDGNGFAVVTYDTVNVGSAPSTTSITGLNTVCLSSSITLADTASGGVWSSSNAAIATVSTTGVVTGLSTGIVNISYNTITSCGSLYAIKSITVNAFPTVSIISGSGSVCISSYTTLTDSIAGGIWSATNSSASVISGIVTGVSSGIDTIIYTVSNTCGAVSAKKVVTINPLPSTGTIVGSSLVCVGSTDTLTESISGGTWSSSSSAIASINATGVVYGNASGIVTITYTNTFSCGSAITTFNITVNPLPDAGTILGTPSVCVAANTTLSDTISGGTWTFSNTNASNIGGVIQGLIAGIDTLSYTVTNICGTATTTALITINPLPIAGIISGSDSLCIGGVATLSETVAGGTWSCNNLFIATIGSTGIVTGVSSGLDTINYIVTNSCGTINTNYQIVVNPMPTSGIITGDSVICVSSNTTLSNTVPGGTWSATNGNASVLSGVVIGISSGIDTINYTITASCGISTSSYPITINSVPAAAAISGGSNLCIGTPDTLSASISGGTWISSNPAIATVSALGIISGLSGGNTVISYTNTYTCGNAIATFGITVNLLPNAGSITGNTSMCLSSLDTLTDTVSGGVWNATNTNATIISGIVTAVSAGIDTIQYLVSNSCGTSFASKIITINSLPFAGTITGSSIVCVGSLDSLSNLVSGGTWSEASTAIGTISSSGVFTGLSTGIDTITYTKVYTCGVAIANFTITVNPLPNAGSISGSNSLCLGASDTLTDTVLGGSWTASNSNATVTGGIVLGGAAGVDTILYTLTNSCGNSTASKVVSINSIPSAGTISGSSTVCIGVNDTLTDPVSGGTWSSSNPLIASISTSGIVNGLSTGNTTISYTTVYSCGTAVATKNITVNQVPNAGFITGDSTLCVTTPITLTNTTTGGIWSASNNTASISTGGVVTGVTSGRDTITYSITNSCGSASVQKIITVSVITSSGTISGDSTVCIGASTLLSETLFGGSWSSSNNLIATVSNSGFVTGVGAGIATISYSIVGICGTSVSNYNITVNSISNAGVISGGRSVCLGSSLALSETVSGGIWSSSNASIATINSLGLLNSLDTGTAIISYTISGSCGLAYAMDTIIVHPEPAPISGSSHVCVFQSITLSDVTTGGSWLSSNNTLASVNTAGIVSAYSAGTIYVFYKLATGCYDSIAITIAPIPNVGSISGNSTVCQGATDTLIDTASGISSSWHSSNSTLATVSNGIVFALNSGIDTISYTVINACGANHTTKIITINPLPTVLPITGLDSVCLGTTMTLHNSTLGGTWSSSNAAISSISTAGAVVGLTAGTDTISYTLTNTCGATSATKINYVKSLHPTGIVSGADSVCIGDTILLTPSLTGGYWTTINTNAALISASGLAHVVGVTAGIDSIHYNFTNYCGTSFIKVPVIIKPLANPGIISGLDSICINAHDTLSETVGGGVWSCINTFANISPTSGILTGLSSGLDTILYTVHNTCGTRNTLKTIFIKPLANAGLISGMDTVCTLSSITLSETVPSGVWSHMNNSDSISSNGVIYGLSNGLDTIFYAVTNVCGTSVTSTTVAVISIPNAIISGSDNICVGSVTTFSSNFSGGSWSVSNSNASISDSLINGISVGIDSVNYTVANVCGSNIATKLINVITTPQLGEITGISGVCIGNSTTLTDTSLGGTWSINNTTIATQSGGIVYGITPGWDTVYYSKGNSCGTSQVIFPIDVISQPSANVTGLFHICLSGNPDTLTGSPSGGVWVARNNNATISPSGIVSAVTEGTDNIVYTYTNSCGSASDSITMYVYTAWQCDSVNAVPIINNLENNIKIYPNPSNGQFTVELIESANNIKTSLIDMYGNIIDKKDILERSQRKFNYNINNLSTGTYILLVSIDGTIYRKKIIITN